MHVQDALQRNESYSMFCFFFFLSDDKIPQNRPFSAILYIKRAVEILETNKLVTSTRYLGHRTFAHLSLHSLFRTWNLPGRYVVGECAALSVMYKGIVLHAVLFDNDEGNAERSRSSLGNKSGLNGS